MDFHQILDLINQKIKELYHSDSGEFESGAEEIHNHLLLLEVKFPQELANLLSSHPSHKKLSILEKKVLKKLHKDKLSYSVVPELNQLYIKDQNRHVIQAVSLTNLDQLLDFHLDLKSTQPNFWVIKNFLIKNHRLEILALAHGLDL